MAKEPKSQKKSANDLTKTPKKTDVELKEDDLGRVTGGSGGGAGLKLDYKE